MSNTKIYRFELLQSRALLAFKGRVEDARAQLIQMEQELAQIESDLTRLEARRKQSASEILKVVIAARIQDIESLQDYIQDEISKSKLALEVLELEGADRPEFIPVDYLIGPGLGLHGKLYYAYVSKGASGGIEASFSPFGVLGINFKISGSISAGGAKQRSLVVYRAPSFVTTNVTEPRRAVAQPLQINSFVGKNWQFTVKGGLELSVGWEFRAGVAAKREEGETKYEPDSTNEHTTERDQKMREERATEIEMVGIGFEVKAGIQAERAYKYETFYAEDLFPLRYEVGAFDETLRRDFAQILQEGSTKTMLKARACELMRQNPALFPDENVDLHRTYFIRWVKTQSSEKVADALWRHIRPEDFEKARDDEKKVLRKAVDLARTLDLYAPPSSTVARARAYEFIKRLNLDTGGLGARPNARPLEYRSSVEEIPVATLYGILGGQAASIASYVQQNAQRQGTSASAAKALGEAASEDLQYFRKLLAPHLIDSATVETTLAILKNHHPSSKDQKPCMARPDGSGVFCCPAPLPAANPVAVLDYLNAVTSRRSCKEVQARHAAHGGPAPEETLVFLSITSDEHSGNGGGFATAAVEGQAIAVSGKLGARVTLGYAKVEKTSHCRFQTASSLANTERSGDAQTVLTSFETVITYSQERFGPTVEIEAALKVLHKEYNIDQIERVKKTKEKVEGFLTEKSWTLNSMHYRTTIASWLKPSNTAASKGNVPLLAGSGVAIGAPFVLDSLRSLYLLSPNDGPSFMMQIVFEAYAANEGGPDWRKMMGGRVQMLQAGRKPPPKLAATARLRYLNTIADQLKLWSGLPKDAQYPASFVVASFLASDEVNAHITDLTNTGLLETGALLLEATYRLTNPPTVSWVSTSDENRPNRRVVTLDALASRQVYESPYQLESLRLRYRKCDHVIKDREVFSLGFSLAGTGLGVKIASIDRAGHEEISDLATLFFKHSDPNSFMWKRPPEDLAEKVAMFDTAVPPSPLFCQ